MTQQLLSSPVPRARPYRICNWDRSIRKGLVAESLRDLLDKVSMGGELVLGVSCPACLSGLSSPVASPSRSVPRC